MRATVKPVRSSSLRNRTKFFGASRWCGLCPATLPGTNGVGMSDDVDNLDLEQMLLGDGPLSPDILEKFRNSPADWRALVQTLHAVAVGTSFGCDPEAINQNDEAHLARIGAVPGLHFSPDPTRRPWQPATGPCRDWRHRPPPPSTRRSRR